MVRIVMMTVLALGLVAIGMVLSNYLRHLALRKQLGEKFRLERDLKDFFNRDKRDPQS